MRINFSAPERYLSKLKQGAEVSVSTTAYPDDLLKGKISVIEPVLDPDTRNVQVVAKVKNPDRKFRPGMSANVTVILSERPNALTIPNESVFANGNQSFVYVIKKDSSVGLIPVTLGSQTADVVEILDGLEQGMQIVQAGHQKLFEGAKVMPIISQKPQTKQ